MIRRILQTKHDKVITPLMSFGGSRRSSYQSTQLQASLTKSIVQKEKNASQIQSNETTHRSKLQNKQTCVSKKLIASKQNITKVLQEKNQNASCLYSDFIYKSKNAHFLEGFKLQKYKNFLQKQTQQKLSLAKKVQNLKANMEKIMAQKQTVMFAYRALQTKIRQINLQRQKQRQKKINFIQKSRHSIGMEKSVEDYYIQQIEEELMKSRKTLLSHGILDVAVQPASISNISNSNIPQISIKRISQESRKFGLGYMKPSNQKSDPIFQQFNQSTNNEQKLKLQAQILSLRESNSKLKEQLSTLSLKANQFQMQIQSLNLQIYKQRQVHKQLKISFKELTQVYENLKGKYDENQKDVQRKLQIIKQLEETKYQYLMKEEKEKQQIQQLKKFTQNLQFNDQKIKQFIRTQFNSDMTDGPMTQQRLFKEDLSYILHLTKKKQNVYSQFLNENLQKLKEYQTRCFMLQKKQHIAQIFFQKLKSVVLQGQNAFNFSNLIDLIEKYHIDKRLI